MILALMADRCWPRLWPSLVAFLAGNLVAWAWVAVYLTQSAGDAQDGIFMAMLLVVAGMASYATSYALRLWRWWQRRQGRPPAG
jgi:hypothetical protein